MGITSNDIAAQRAMLERGEEKRKEAEQTAERERLRDTFAAAALTGLLMNGDYSTDSIPSLAYSMADAMLRERGTAVRDNCVSANNPEIGCPVTEPMPKDKRAEVSDWRSHIRPLDAADRHALQKCDEAWGIVHDAVPAAIVSTPDENSLHAASELGNPGAASRQCEVTGNTHQPVAWAVYCGKIAATLRSLLARLA